MKSAKRLNRKLVKSRLTKKRQLGGRQVGRGQKNYTVKYIQNINGVETEKEVEIAINIDEGEGTGRIEPNDVNKEMIMETRIPTINQYNTYFNNYKATQKSCPNAGLFVVIDSETGVLYFYKLSNGKSEKVDANNTIINIESVIFGYLNINGIYFTHSSDDDPVLFPEEPKFKRAKGFKKRPKTTDVSKSPTSYIIDGYKHPSSTSNSRKASLRKSSSNKPGSRKSSKRNNRNNRGVVKGAETLYSTVVKPEAPEAPKLPPRKPAPYGAK